MFGWLKEKVYSILGHSVTSTENVVDETIAVPKTVQVSTVALLLIGAYLLFAARNKV